MDMDNVTPMNGRRTVRAKVEKHEATILELQLQIARLDAKLSLILWGVGFLISTQVGWYLSHL